MTSYAVTRFSSFTDRATTGATWFAGLPTSQQTDINWLLSNTPVEYMVAVASVGLDLSAIESLSLARHLFRSVPLGAGTLFDLLADPRLQAVITTGELMFAGQASPGDLNDARIAAIAACHEIADAGPAGSSADDISRFNAALDAAVATCAPTLGTHSTETSEIQYVVPAMVEAGASAAAGFAWMMSTHNSDIAWGMARRVVFTVLAEKTCDLILART